MIQHDFLARIRSSKETQVLPNYPTRPILYFPEQKKPKSD